MNQRRDFLIRAVTSVGRNAQRNNAAAVPQGRFMGVASSITSHNFLRQKRGLK